MPDGTVSDHVHRAECPTCGLVDLVMFGWVSVAPCGCVNDGDIGILGQRK
jgi:hypothetical protein